MSIKLVTSLNKPIYDSYAKNTLASWVEFLQLPEGSEIELWFWGEIPQGLPMKTKSGTPFVYKMFDVNCQGWQHFIDTYRNHPKPKTPPGQEYVYNFVPFSCKVYALAETAWELKQALEYRKEHPGTADSNVNVFKFPRFDHLVWLDVDVELVKPVTGEFLREVLGNHKFAWLDRNPPWGHGETGFMMAYADQDTLDLFLQVANTYGSGQLFYFAQWHDAFVYSAYIKLKEFTEPEFKVKNLNLDVKNAVEQGLHPFKTSVLNDYMKHYKGQLKNKVQQGPQSFSEVVFN